jgi:hypothetical protein
MLANIEVITVILVSSTDSQQQEKNDEKLTGKKFVFLCN